MIKIDDCEELLEDDRDDDMLIVESSGSSSCIEASIDHIPRGLSNVRYLFIRFMITNIVDAAKKISSTFVPSVFACHYNVLVDNLLCKYQLLSQCSSDKVVEMLEISHQLAATCRRFPRPQACRPSLQESVLTSTTPLLAMFKLIGPSDQKSIVSLVEGFVRDSMDTTSSLHTQYLAMAEIKKIWSEQPALVQSACLQSKFPNLLVKLFQHWIDHHVDWLATNGFTTGVNALAPIGSSQFRLGFASIFYSVSNPIDARRLVEVVQFLSIHCLRHFVDLIDVTKDCPIELPSRSVEPPAYEPEYPPFSPTCYAEPVLESSFHISPPFLPQLPLSWCDFISVYSEVDASANLQSKDGNRKSLISQLLVAIVAIINSEIQTNRVHRVQNFLRATMELGMSGANLTSRQQFLLVSSSQEILERHGLYTVQDPVTKLSWDEDIVVLASLTNMFRGSLLCFMWKPTANKRSGLDILTTHLLRAPRHCLGSLLQTWVSRLSVEVSPPLGMSANLFSALMLESIGELILSVGDKSIFTSDAGMKQWVAEIFEESRRFEIVLAKHSERKEEDGTNSWICTYLRNIRTKLQTILEDGVTVAFLEYCGSDGSVVSE